ncbi:MAG TPA: glycosyltransferase [Flavobacteriales bacterium]|nr:glycosyltransferase [Flavobacteriales bacterium]
MKLSVIIVNYNVEYFLEQCLHSVCNALKNTPAEIIVVDNNSFDASCEMVKTKFPHVILIENKINTGFSKANNQAMRIAKGQYVLLLNPDTIVEETTFEKTLDFMNTHPDAGGLGVFMIDGKGNFLPESKRGLPTPWVAFYKIFGLSRLFPRSKKFNRYYLGHLSKNETNEIEILSGAFMLMRKQTLDKVGLLDEQFFMYGEDIDLSYRIIKGGYKNYYFPHTKIIHYKGESTKKSSVNYVFVFYQAMIIFARKHFSQKNAKIFTFLIKSAIYFRAGLALFTRGIRQIWIPAMDAAAIFGGLKLIEHFYFVYTGISWPLHITNLFFPAYILIWLGFTWLFGGYDKPFKPLRMLKGLAVGSVLLLVIYALLPKEWQFSRSLILAGAVWALISMLLMRLMLNLFKVSGYQFGKRFKKRFIIVGNETECQRVENILSQTNIKTESVKRIFPSETELPDGFEGNLSQLNEVIHFYKIDEIIFCAQDNSAQSIMRHMSEITQRNLDFKIAQPDSLFLIGSNSVNTSGELYMLEINSIDSKQNRRFKRVNDLLLAVLLLVFSPIMVLFQERKKGYFKNIFLCLIGKKTIVGYYPISSNKQLPKIKPGILNPFSDNAVQHSESTREKLNLIYARDFSVFTDLRIISKNLAKLGR